MNNHSPITILLSPNILSLCETRTSRSNKYIFKYSNLSLAKQVDPKSTNPQKRIQIYTPHLI